LHCRDSGRFELNRVASYVAVIPSVVILSGSATRASSRTCANSDGVAITRTVPVDSQNDLGVIVEIKRVINARRVDTGCPHQKGAWILLGTSTPWRAFRWQPRQSDVDTILSLHLCDIRVGAALERAGIVSATLLALVGLVNYSIIQPQPWCSMGCGRSVPISALPPR